MRGPGHRRQRLPRHARSSRASSAAGHEVVSADLRVPEPARRSSATSDGRRATRPRRRGRRTSGGPRSSCTSPRSSRPARTPRASSSTPSTSTAPGNVLDACLAHGVRRDRRLLQRRGLRLPPGQPGVDHRGPAGARQRGVRLRHHKRLVEEMLAELRSRDPSSSRWCCGSARSSASAVDNQITALFERPRLLKIRGVEVAVRLHLGHRRRRDHPAGGDRRRSPASSTSPATAR